MTKKKRTIRQIVKATPERKKHKAKHAMTSMNIDEPVYNMEIINRNWMAVGALLLCCVIVICSYVAHRIRVYNDAQIATPPIVVFQDAKGVISNQPYVDVHDNTVTSKHGEIYGDLKINWSDKLENKAEMQSIMASRNVTLGTHIIHVHKHKAKRIAMHFVQNIEPQQYKLDESRIGVAVIHEMTIPEQIALNVRFEENNPQAWPVKIVDNRQTTESAIVCRLTTEPDHIDKQDENNRFTSVGFRAQPIRTAKPCEVAQNIVLLGATPQLTPVVSK